MIDISSNIKLVVWDMDETFWKGTISEEDVTIIPENIEIINELINRGIMCSISSKNDFDVVKNKLVSLGIWDFFVFPKINWNPKAAQIKQTIEDCNLRATNVLFIDDNPHNLGEAQQYIPTINVMTPDAIPSLLDMKYLQGNQDNEHKRLQQFKILEEKQIAKQTCSSNKDFLIKSNIKVFINYDCENHKERLLDLINRSNQLNYTKIRLTSEQLDDLLSNTKCKNSYITVKDNYGDYGIVGFISLEDGLAKHFLFSCRTIGMGIEQYVYSQFNYPDFIQEGEVISNVEKEGCPDWINMNVGEDCKSKAELDISVLLHGGCDLSQVEPYINFKKFTTEYNILQYHRDHTVFALDAYYKYPELASFLENVPFLWEKNFETEIFDKKHDVIIISVLQDYIQCVYEYKNNRKIKISYDYFGKPYNKDYTGRFTYEEMRWFLDNFEAIGRISNDDFYNNLKFIRDNIGEDTILLIINGCELPHERSDEPDQYLIHKEMNKVVDKFVEDTKNTYLVDVRKFVTTRQDLSDSIRHYAREVYFKIAQEMTDIIYQVTGKKYEATEIDDKKTIKVNKPLFKRLIRNIFSVTNARKEYKKYKVLTILGIKFKIMKKRIIKGQLKGEKNA